MLFSKSKKQFRKSDLIFWAMLLPAVITVILYSYLPIGGLVLAFKDYKPRMGIFGSPWAKDGLFSHFKEIFTTPGITAAIGNTLYINLLALIVQFPAPIIFSLLLEEVRKMWFKNTVQTISFLPHFLSMAAATGIATSMLSKYGILNEVLVFFGLPRSEILKNPSAFIPVYLLVDIWKNVGWGSIIYLSAISAISPELYESATIDGAGRFKQVTKITVPLILPAIMIQLIFQMGRMFSSNFELMYGLQNVAWDKEVISTITYKYGLQQGEYELSVALSLVEGLVALILTFGANFISKKVSDVSMW